MHSGSGRRDVRCSPGKRLALLHVHEVRGRGRQGAVRKQPDRQPLDDWLGDISDQDWSEDAAELAEQRRATPVRQERSTPESHTERDGLAVSPAQALPVATTEARRAAVQRRRAVAALVLLLLIGLAAAAAVLLLRDGAEPPVTPAPESPIVTTPTPTETDPVPTTPSTTPTDDDAGRAERERPDLHASRGHEAPARRKRRRERPHREHRSRAHRGAPACSYEGRLRPRHSRWDIRSEHGGGSRRLPASERTVARRDSRP